MIYIYIILYILGIIFSSIYFRNRMGEKEWNEKEYYDNLSEGEKYFIKCIFIWYILLVLHLLFDISNWIFGKYFKK